VAAASKQQLRRSSSVRPSSVATSAAADASMLASRATVSAASPASAPAALPCTHRYAGHSRQHQVSESWAENSTTAFPTAGAARAVPAGRQAMGSQRSPHLKVLHAARHISSAARQLSKLGRRLPQPLPGLHRRRHVGSCGGPAGVPSRGLPRALVL
jgi:hypothetical protein